MMLVHICFQGGGKPTPIRDLFCNDVAIAPTVLEEYLSCTSNDTEETGQRQMKTEVTVTLSRLNCNGCVRNVNKALQTLAEVEVVQTDIPTKTVRLRHFESQISLEQIKTVLLEAGYPVVEEKASA